MDRVNFNAQVCEAILKRNDLDAILLFSVPARGNLSPSVYFHEFGHVMYEKISPSHLKRWTDLWKKYYAFLPRYGRTNPSEGFAEAFRLYFEKPLSLPFDIRKFFDSLS